MQAQEMLMMAPPTPDPSAIPGGEDDIECDVETYEEPPLHEGRPSGRCTAPPPSPTQRARELAQEHFRRGLYLDAEVALQYQPPPRKNRASLVALPAPTRTTGSGGASDIYRLNGLHGTRRFVGARGMASGHHLEVKTSQHEVNDAAGTRRTMEFIEVRLGYESPATRALVSVHGPCEPGTWSLSGSPVHRFLKKIEPGDRGHAVCVEPTLPLLGNGPGSEPWTEVCDFVPRHGLVLVCDPTPRSVWAGLPWRSRERGPWYCAASMTVTFEPYRGLFLRPLLRAHVSIHQDGEPTGIGVPSWTLEDVPRGDARWVSLCGTLTPTPVRNSERWVRLYGR